MGLTLVLTCANADKNWVLLESQTSQGASCVYVCVWVWVYVRVCVYVFMCVCVYVNNLQGTCQ